MWRGLGPVPGLAIGLTLPGAVVLFGLVLVGELGFIAAVAAAVTLLLLAALIVTPLALSLEQVREEIANLAPGSPGELRDSTRWARRLSPAVRAFWPAIVRLVRAWRLHASELEARAAAADAIIAAVPDPLILIDRNRRVVRANPASADFIGFASEQRDLATLLRNPLLLAAADAVLRGAPTRVVEFAVAGPVARLLQARIARIAWPNPAITLGGAAAILTLHDITALKQAEQMRADFIANAGHELKTPLASLIGFIETLLGPARDDVAARDRFLGIMREQAGRMARLVDDLLSLSRIELNEHVAPTARVAVDEIIERVAAGLELRAAARGITLSLALPAGIPAVLGEADELAQVFQNLLDNAIKYARRDSEVTVSAEARPGQVRVSVRDRGDGIAGDHLPRLTERFYRVDTARSREMGGTGLGLAIVKHILNRHRGRLEIASTLGEGSTFTVWLPAPAGDVNISGPKAA